MILNGPTNSNPVRLNEVSVVTWQFVRVYLSTYQETLDPGTYGHGY
mgnify:CR=1 FL=1